MRALVLSHGTLALRDVPFTSTPQECRIRVSLAGICGTDLQLLEGYAGFDGIPGHEFVGVVEDAPPADRAWIGRRVVGEINVGCGRCALCRAGVKEHCADRTVVGIRGRAGAFAEWLSLPASNLHAVPDTVDDRAAVFVEPIAAACRILEQIDIARDTRIAVIGDGRLGLLVAQVLGTASGHVCVFGRHAEKLAIARQLGIATAQTRPPQEQANPPQDEADQAPCQEHVARDFSPATFDVVVDATGRKEGLAQAIDLVRPRGTIVMKSTFHGEASTALWPAVVHEVTMVGSRCGPFARALGLLAAGSVKTVPLLSGEIPLDRYQDGFEAARRQLKVVFRI